MGFVFEGMGFVRFGIFVVLGHAYFLVSVLPV